MEDGIGLKRGYNLLGVLYMYVYVRVCGVMKGRASTVWMPVYPTVMDLCMCAPGNVLSVVC